MREGALAVLATVWILLAGAAVPASGSGEDEGALRVDLTLAAGETPPRLTATLVSDRATLRWPLPGGVTLGAVTDGDGSGVASRVEDGNLIVDDLEATGGVLHVSFTLGSPRNPGRNLTQVEFRLNHDADVPTTLQVAAPAGRELLHAEPASAADGPVASPADVRLLFGPPDLARENPPTHVSLDGLTVLHEVNVTGPGNATLTRTLWWNASQHSYTSRETGIPRGWILRGAEDAWGPVGFAVHGTPGDTHAWAEPWTAGEGASMLRLRFRLDPREDAHPVVPVSVPADDARTRHFLKVQASGEAAASVVASHARVLDGAWHPSGTGLHVVVDLGLPGWNVTRAGRFVVYAPFAETADFVAEAARRAKEPLERSLEAAGLPARDAIPLVVMPAAVAHRGWDQGGWPGWGAPFEGAMVGSLRTSGDAWELAALIVHEAFHGGHRDAAPFLESYWWTEGAATETLRAFPRDAFCRGNPRDTTPDCINAPDLRTHLPRFEADPEAFDFGWSPIDRALTPEDVRFGYEVSAFLVAHYRDEAGEEAWRDVWEDLTARGPCCAPEELVDVLLHHAPHLNRANVTRPLQELRETDPQAYAIAVQPYLEYRTKAAIAPEPTGEDNEADVTNGGDVGRKTRAPLRTVPTSGILALVACTLAVVVAVARRES